MKSLFHTKTAAFGDTRQRLIDYAMSITDEDMVKVALAVTTNDNFFGHPASMRVHHAYVSGLAIHTLEVVENAEKLALSFPQADRNIIILSAIWHDYAKVWDYESKRFYPNAKGEYFDLPRRHVLIAEEKKRMDGSDERVSTHKDAYVESRDYKDRVHHVSGSAMEFTHVALSHGIGRINLEKVQHCILSHHGRRDWGSLIEPQSLEACLLHYADYLSSHFGHTVKEPVPWAGEEEDA